MMTAASGVSPERITNYTKPLSSMVGRAGKQSIGGRNCTTLANAAGVRIIAGGMKMATAGAPIMIGTITIMIITPAIGPDGTGP
jgi:hypothetical protein